MTPQPGEQTIPTHTFTNISSGTGNQAMKFGQLIKNNMRNIFLEKSYTKYGRETIPRLFSKKVKIEHISGVSKVLYILL